MWKMANELVGVCVCVFNMPKHKMLELKNLKYKNAKNVLCEYLKYEKCI